MASYNKVLLMGNLTRDPDVRTLPSGQAVTEIGLAVNRTYTVGGPGGEKREEVTFVDVTLWGRSGELVAQYLHKGDPIFVEGRLTFRQWEAKDGTKRSRVSVTAENFQFIGARREGGGRPGPRSNEESQGAPDPTTADQMEGFDEVPF